MQKCTQIAIFSLFFEKKAEHSLRPHTGKGLYSATPESSPYPVGAVHLLGSLVWGLLLLGLVFSPCRL